MLSVYMESNPYQSPSTVDGSVSRYPGGLHLFGLGFLSGAFVGGTFGAIQAAMLAVILLAALGSGGNSVAIGGAVPAIVAVTFVGSLAGAVIGCMIGPVLGVLLAILGHGSVRLLLVIGCTATTFCSVIASYIAIRNFTPSTSPWNYAAIASGIASGFLGGIVLVRGLVRLARQVSA